METATLYKKIAERVKPKTEDEAAEIYADVYAILKGENSFPASKTKPPHTEAALKSVVKPEAKPAEPEPEHKTPEAKTIYYADKERGLKVCPKCKEEKELEKDFYSYKDSKGRKKFAGYCKECDKKRQSGRKKENGHKNDLDFSDSDYSTETPTVDGKRKCSDCQTFKPLDHFYSREREGKPTLYSCYCKDCARKRSKDTKHKARAAKAAAARTARNKTVAEGIVEYADGVNSKIRNTIKNLYWNKNKTVEEISFALGGMNVEKIKKVLFSSGG